MCSHGFVDPSIDVVEAAGRVGDVEEGEERGRNQMNMAYCRDAQQREPLPMYEYLVRSNRSSASRWRRFADPALLHSH